MKSIQVMQKRALPAGVTECCNITGASCVVDTEITDHKAL